MALSTFAGGRLWGARYGAGRPWALALPGWGRDHHDFDPVLSGLEAVAIDLPGFGVAAEPPSAWSTAEYARFVAPVLDDLADGPIVVVAHSFGARVAVHLAGAGHGAGVEPRAGMEPRAGAAGADGPVSGTGARQGRGRVGALVLTGAPLAPPPGQRPSRPPLSFRAGRALHRAGLLTGPRMERLRRKYGSDDYRKASEVMRGVLVKAVGETESSAYLPVLKDWVTAGGSLELIWGERDQVTSLAGAQAGWASPPGPPLRVTVVPGAGHLIGPAMAEQIRAAVLRQRSTP